MQRAEKGLRIDNLLICPLIEKYEVDTSLKIVEKKLWFLTGKYQIIRLVFVHNCFMKIEMSDVSDKVGLNRSILS